MNICLEFWDFVAGYEGYMVSSLGRVMSLERKVKNGVTFRTVPEKILKLVDRGLGYLAVQLYKNGKHKMVSVHRLVALTFIPPIKGFHTVDHINRKRDDNRVENLRWADMKTQYENSGVSIYKKQQVSDHSYSKKLEWTNNYRKNRYKTDEEYRAKMIAKSKEYHKRKTLKALTRIWRNA